MGRPRHIYTEKYVPRYFTFCLRDKFTIKNGKREMRGSAFKIIETFHVLYYKPMISTPRRKTREVLVQPLLAGTFAVWFNKHTIHIVVQVRRHTCCHPLTKWESNHQTFRISKAYNGFASARFATSRTGHDNILKWNSSEDTAGNCVTPSKLKQCFLCLTRVFAHLPQH